LSYATPINREHTTKVGVRNYALLLVACVAFHVIGTWSLPLIDRDEPRFAEASREMIERGDYVVPHFNNQYRFDKPPLAYWAQVGSYRIFGENDFAARFPSVITAALIALSILAWGARIGGDRVGWWAAIIFTLSLQVFAHAKAAVADMWLVLFVTLAHWAVYELIYRQKTPNAQRPTPNIKWSWWLTLYISLALAFLAKGPIGFVPLLTVGATKLQNRKLQLGKRFAFVRGIALTLAVISLWAIPAIIQTNGEFLRVGIGRHVIGRSFGTMEGHGASTLLVYFLLLPFYFVTIFVSFFPWSIKLPWLVRRLWRNSEAAVSDPGYRARDKIDNYLLAGSAIVFVIFTVVRTKLPHYTLPAFPLLALLVARQLVSIDFPLRRFKTIAIAATAVFLGVALIVPPLAAPSFPARELFRQSQNDLRPEMEFGAVDFAEPSLVWYFRSRVKGWMFSLNRQSVQLFMGKSGARFVIMPTKLAETDFANLPPTWKTFSTHGFNVAKGKHVDLTLILKPE
jgi:4-amino-4-deoxy-L-arabinose transferase-like glycosyltransferase